VITVRKLMISTKLTNDLSPSNTRKNANSPVQIRNCQRTQAVAARQKANDRAVSVVNQSRVGAQRKLLDDQELVKFRKLRENEVHFLIFYLF
jgi:hypothetical protein